MTFDQYKEKYEPVLENWRIIREIGTGSSGKVFEINREENGKVYKAALKVVSIPQNDDQVQNIKNSLGLSDDGVTKYFYDIVNTLTKEINLLADLQDSPYIVGYADHRVIKSKNKIHWDILIIMELLTPLSKYITDNKLTENDVIKLGKDICNALILCEKKKIIHRDIKPDSIFKSGTGSYKLGDFSVARICEMTAGASTKVGNRDYMAPEVYDEKKYDYRADIYSLGIVMYRLLNGERLPFFPPAPHSVSYSERNNAIKKRMRGEEIPAPANASPAMAKIILKACAYSPEDRFSSPVSMLNSLEKLSGPTIFPYPTGDPIHPPGPEPPKPTAIFELNSNYSRAVNNSNYIGVEIRKNGKDTLLYITNDIYLMNEDYDKYGYIPIFQFNEESDRKRKSFIIYANDSWLFIDYINALDDRAYEYVFFIDDNTLRQLIGIVKIATSWEYEYVFENKVAKMLWEIKCIVKGCNINSHGASAYPKGYIDCIDNLGSFVDELKKNFINKGPKRPKGEETNPPEPPDSPGGDDSKYPNFRKALAICCSVLLVILVGALGIGYIEYKDLKSYEIVDESDDIAEIKDYSDFIIMYLLNDDKDAYEYFWRGTLEGLDELREGGAFFIQENLSVIGITVDGGVVLNAIDIWKEDVKRNGSFKEIDESIVKHKKGSNNYIVEVHVEFDRNTIVYDVGFEGKALCSFERADYNGLKSRFDSFLIDLIDSRVQ